MVKKYNIYIDCAVCAEEMERRINKVEGVEKAVISFMAQKLTVNFTDSADIPSIEKEMLRAAKKFSRDCNIEI